AAASASLILSVFKYPELYNVTLPNYRCTESRASAWRSISSELGLSPEECKRKWKNMRDRYLKEIRTEIKSKKQGEVIQSKWKYRQLMNFIAPFTGSRSGVADICGNDDDQDTPDMDSVDGETSLSEVIKAPQSITKIPVSPPEIKSHMTFVSQIPSASQDTQLAQLAALAKMPSGQQMTPANNNGASFPARPRDEDELFLLSFVPALKRLAPQKRCETKMKIQQIMYEAEFNVAQSDEQKLDSEMPN
uniref:BESS domain-containing protein n=1 Tax=Salarias fasciatus TaxID=181472 RepID=A0A672FWE9_SALFA